VFLCDFGSKHDGEVHFWLLSFMPWYITKLNNWIVAVATITLAILNTSREAIELRIKKI